MSRITKEAIDYEMAIVNQALDLIEITPWEESVTQTYEASLSTLDDAEAESKGSLEGLLRKTVARRHNIVALTAFHTWLSRDD